MKIEFSQFHPGSWSPMKAITAVIIGLINLTTTTAQNALQSQEEADGSKSNTLWQSIGTIAVLAGATGLFVWQRAIQAKIKDPTTVTPETTTAMNAREVVNRLDALVASNAKDEITQKAIGLLIVRASEVEDQMSPQEVIKAVAAVNLCFMMNLVRMGVMHALGKRMHKLS